jgi:hypothetical protein
VKEMLATAVRRAPMIKVTEDDIGRTVIYRPRGLPPEEGVIVAFTESFVFVRFAGEQFSKATQYRDLEQSAP